MFVKNVPFLINNLDKYINRLNQPLCFTLNFIKLQKKHSLCTGEESCGFPGSFKKIIFKLNKYK